MGTVSKARPKKSSQKPRSLKQRKGPSHNRRHGKAIRADEAAKRKRRTAKPSRGMSSAAQKHPPAPQDTPLSRTKAKDTPRDTYDRAFGDNLDSIGPDGFTSNARFSHDHPALDHSSASLPLIAITGRPNVGKSTLFNRLTGSRRSIVGDEPGITRDRIYAPVEWSGREARLVDTGGIVPDDEALIPSEIFRQARVAFDDASAIILVVDGRTELASPDLELARLLIRTGKPLFLAVNKMDTPALDASAPAYHSLGIRHLFPVSAEHGSGIGDLLDAVFAILPTPPVQDLSQDSLDHSAPGDSAHVITPDDLDNASLDSPPDDSTPDADADSPAHVRTHAAYQQHETKVAIIGRPNVGKSTLLNVLTGTDRAIVSPVAGTTRDAVDELVTRDGHDYRFVDTAGIRRKGKTHLMAEKLSVVMARKHLEAADLAVLVIDAVEGVTALDATIGGYAHESGRSVVIAVNKWDLVGPARTDGKPPADIKVYEERLRRSLKFLDYAPVVFLSALDAHSNPKHIGRLFQQIALVARERRKRVSTGQMNRFVGKLDFQRAPVPMSRRMRIFYMTQAAVAPPTFILFTDRAVKLHFAFERFLENQLRAAFGFTGSPLWFKVRARKKEPAKR
jgi:GTP-binding protein